MNEKGDEDGAEERVAHATGAKGDLADRAEVGSARA